MVTAALLRLPLARAQSASNSKGALVVGPPQVANAEISTQGISKTTLSSSPQPFVVINPSCSCSACVGCDCSCSCSCSCASCFCSACTC